MKPIDVTDDSFAEYNEESNKKDPKFKIGDHVRISKYSKINNTVPWKYVISDLNGEDITGGFYEKELQRTNQKICRIEKIIKRAINYMSNGRDMIIHSIVGLIKQRSCKNK